MERLGSVSVVAGRVWTVGAVFLVICTFQFVFRLGVCVVLCADGICPGMLASSTPVCERACNPLENSIRRLYNQGGVEASGSVLCFRSAVSEPVRFSVAS